MAKGKEKTGSESRRRYAGRRVRKRIDQVLPASFRNHLKASIREGLLAFESLFDEAVKALEKEGRGEQRRRSRKVKVE